MYPIPCPDLMEKRMAKDNKLGLQAQHMLAPSKMTVWQGMAAGQIHIAKTKRLGISTNTSLWMEESTLKEYSATGFWKSKIDKMMSFWLTKWLQNKLNINRSNIKILNVHIILW